MKCLSTLKPVRLSYGVGTREKAELLWPCPTKNS